MTILLIDDDDGILQAVRFALEAAGHRVIARSDGRTIAEDIAAHAPALLIVDLLLSGDDGAAIAARLKADPATTGIPIMIMSAHPSAQHTVTESGADAFLAKPFGIDELLAAVERLGTRASGGASSGIHPIAPF